MRRVSGVALIVSFLSFVAQAALLHVHVYADHEHDEHHHGAAAHSHHDEDEPAEASGEGEHFVPCEPASHVESVAFYSPAPQPASVLFAPTSWFSFNFVAPSSEPVMVSVDARGHSPPRRPHRPLRAPPRQIPA